MLPLVILGAAAWYLSRPQRNPDWITVEGKHIPLRHGDGRKGDPTPYDPAKVGEKGTPRATPRAASGSASSSALLYTSDIKALQRETAAAVQAADKMMWSDDPARAAIEQRANDTAWALKLALEQHHKNLGEPAYNSEANASTKAARLAAPVILPSDLQGEQRAAYEEWQKSIQNLAAFDEKVQSLEKHSALLKRASSAAKRKALPAITQFNKTKTAEDEATAKRLWAAYNDAEEAYLASLRESRNRAPLERAITDAAKTAEQRTNGQIRNGTWRANNTPDRIALLEKRADKAVQVLMRDPQVRQAWYRVRLGELLSKVLTRRDARDLPRALGSWINDEAFARWARELYKHGGYYWLHGGRTSPHRIELGLPPGPYDEPLRR